MLSKYIAVAMLLLGCLSGCVPRKEASGKPNVVIFNVDDLGWTGVGCYGCKLIDTPNIDRLAADGVRFTDAYASAPNCSSSRAGLLTGLYPPKHGITQVLFAEDEGELTAGRKLATPDVPEGLNPDLTTIAEVFHSAGYATASIGKWHLGDERFYPDKHGFDVNIGGNEKGHLDQLYPPYFRDREMPGSRKGEHITDYLLRNTLDCIDRKKGSPLFLYISFYSVHHPRGGNLVLQRKYAERFAAEFGNNKETQVLTAYAAMTEGVDRFVGAVRRKFQEIGAGDNTIFILTSDNGAGYKLGNRGLRGRKGFLYEGGIRVPCIFAGPGVRKGVVFDTPVDQVDFMPTLAGMAGLSAPPCDGVDLQPILGGRGEIAERDLFWHFPHYSKTSSTPVSAMRSGDYKLIHYYEDDRWELYNLKKDLGESTNLIEDEPEVSARMRQGLEQWLKESNAKLPEAGSNIHNQPAVAKGGHSKEYPISK